MKKSRAGALLLIVAIAVFATAILVGSLSAEAPQYGASSPITVNDASITQTTTFNSRLWSWQNNQATTAEIFWDIDQEGGGNSLDLDLYASPDNVLWASVGNLVTGNTTDTVAYSTTNIIGSYFRVVATAAGSDPVTPTIKVVLR